MKKLTITAIALVMAQGIVFAQGTPQVDRKDKMHMMHTLTPEETATLKTKRMALHLDLNKSQQDEVYKINLENATKRKEMVADWRSKKQNGDVQKPSKEKRLEIMNGKLDRQIAIKAKMKKILNDEQYGKWEKAQAKSRKGIKNKKMVMKKKNRKK